MPPLPRLSATELRRRLLRLGFIVDRQKGSHIILRHRDDATRYAVLAMHSSGTIPLGTLQQILRTTRVDPVQLMDA